jgi:hypothetical protein
MADLHVAHASSPVAIRTNARPPEPKKVSPNPPQTPKADNSHGPAVVLGGALAKPPVKPAGATEVRQDKPNPVTPPKPVVQKTSSGKTDGPGQHFNHVI